MLNRYRENLELHDKGTPCELVGMTFHVRRLNHKWQEALTEAKREVVKDPFLGRKLTPKEEYKALGMAVSDYLVAGWENVRQHEDGADIPFNYGNAKSIFCNEEYASLVNELLAYAANKENYLHDKLDEDTELAKKLFGGTL